MRVLVGGCFNKIHEGHIKFFRSAKKFGNELIVVLTHDKNNKKAYAVPATRRKKNLQEVKRMAGIDRVVLGNSSDFSKVIKKYKPDIIVLGYDQRLPKIQKGIFRGKIKRLRRYRQKKIIIPLKHP